MELNDTTIAALRERIGTTNWEHTRKHMALWLAIPTVEDRKVARLILDEEQSLATARERLAPVISIACPECSKPSNAPCGLTDPTGRGACSWMDGSWLVCGKRMLVAIGRQDLLALYEQTRAWRLSDDMFDLSSGLRSVLPIHMGSLQVEIGQTVKMENPSSLPFRPRRFLAPRGFSILDITINNKSQVPFALSANHGIPSDLFSADVIGAHPIVFDDLDISMSVCVVATRVASPPAGSHAGFFGSLIGVSGKDRRVLVDVTPEKS